MDIVQCFRTEHASSRLEHTSNVLRLRNTSPWVRMCVCVCELLTFIESTWPATTDDKHQRTPSTDRRPLRRCRSSRFVFFPCAYDMWWCRRCVRHCFRIGYHVIRSLIVLHKRISHTNRSNNCRQTRSDTMPDCVRLHKRLRVVSSPAQTCRPVVMAFRATTTHTLEQRTHTSISTHLDCRRRRPECRVCCNPFGRRRGVRCCVRHRRPSYRCRRRCCDRNASDGLSMNHSAYCRIHPVVFGHSKSICAAKTIRKRLVCVRTHFFTHKIGTTTCLRNGRVDKHTNIVQKNEHVISCHWKCAVLILLRGCSQCAGDDIRISSENAPANSDERCIRHVWIHASASEHRSSAEQRTLSRSMCVC